MGSCEAEARRESAVDDAMKRGQDTGEATGTLQGHESEDSPGGFNGDNNAARRAWCRLGCSFSTAAQKCGLGWARTKNNTYE